MVEVKFLREQKHFLGKPVLNKMEKGTPYLTKIDQVETKCDALQKIIHVCFTHEQKDEELLTKYQNYQEIALNFTQSQKSRFLKLYGI